MNASPALTYRMPALDALRTRIPTVVLFAGSSLASWSVDYALVLILSAVGVSTLQCVVIARLVSCTLNFLINRRLFTTVQPERQLARTGLWSAAMGYTTVQATVMIGSYLLISALGAAGLALWAAKILADSTLFGVNYLVQSRLVYRINAVIAELRARVTAATAPALVGLAG